MPKKSRKKKLKLNFEPEEKKESFTSKLKKLSKPKNTAPITFNLGIVIILFFLYLAVTILTAPTQPLLLLIFLPTLYILARYMKLERDPDTKKLLKQR